MADVTIYYSPICFDCSQAMRFFGEHEVSFVRKNVQDPGVRQELEERAGAVGVPTIMIDGRVFQGFHEHKVEIEDLIE